MDKHNYIVRVVTADYYCREIKIERMFGVSYYAVMARVDALKVEYAGKQNGPYTVVAAKFPDVDDDEV